MSVDLGPHAALLDDDGYRLVSEAVAEAKGLTMTITDDKPLVRHTRWAVVAWYRTESGLIDVPHDIEELAELHAIIERGPSWQALDRIEITYRGVPQKLTIEEADAL